MFRMSDPPRPTFKAGWHKTMDVRTAHGLISAFVTIHKDIHDTGHRTTWISHGVELMGVTAASSGGWAATSRSTALCWVAPLMFRIGPAQWSPYSLVWVRSLA